MALVQDLIRAARRLRREKNVSERAPIALSVSSHDEATDVAVGARAEFLRRMGVLASLEHGVGLERPARSAAAVVGTTEVFFALEGLIDFEAEKARLAKQKSEVEGYIRKAEGQLGSEKFVNNAPAEIVQRQRDRLVELQGQLAKIDQNLAELG